MEIFFSMNILNSSYFFSQHNSKTFFDFIIKKHNTNATFVLVLHLIYFPYERSADAILKRIHRISGIPIIIHKG